MRACSWMEWEGKGAANGVDEGGGVGAASAVLVYACGGLDATLYAACCVPTTKCTKHRGMIGGWCGGGTAVVVRCLGAPGSLEALYECVVCI